MYILVLLILQRMLMLHTKKKKNRMLKKSLVNITSQEVLLNEYMMH